MQIKELMITEVKTCSPETNLAAATDLFWKYDCGILPVVEAEAVVGVITDRDVCIALGRRDRRASEITSGSVATRQVFTCSPEDDVKAALMQMRKGKVRRLPVIDQDRTLVGIISLDDIVTRANVGGTELSYSDLVDTYRALCERRIAVRSAASEAPST